MNVVLCHVGRVLTKNLFRSFEEQNLKFLLEKTPRSSCASSLRYKKIEQSTGKLVDVYAQDIRVGDFIVMESNCRVPADMVFLHTTADSGQTYVRTDQLDGETDWKLRKPVRT